MATAHNFRSAFNGFNREDVVRYIEYMNSKHNTDMNQLRSQIDSLKNELAVRAAQMNPNQETEEALAQSNLRCQELEQECAQLRQQLEEATANAGPSAEELEAYRRAERVERLAQERAAEIRDQAGSILSDASAKVDGAAAQISAIADQVQAQLDQLHAAVANSKQLLQETSAAVSAIQLEK